MLYSYTCVMTIQNTPNVCLNLNKSITPDTRDSRDSRARVLPVDNTGILWQRPHRLPGSINARIIFLAISTDMSSVSSTILSNRRKVQIQAAWGVRLDMAPLFLDIHFSHDVLIFLVQFLHHIHFDMRNVMLCDKWFQGMKMPAADNSVASPSMYPSLLATASEGSLPTEEERMLFLKRREFLLDIGSRFSRATELKVLLKDGVERARGLMHADRGTIFVVDHENSQMWTTVAEGLRGKEIVIPLGAGLVGACYKSGAVINVKDAVK